MTGWPRAVTWRRVMDDLSVEQMRLEAGAGGPALSGTVLIAEAGLPLRVDYRIECDRAWSTRTVVLTQTHGADRVSLRMDHDGAGRWWRDGAAAPDLDGCTDVDLGVSPSTNALPINRLRLTAGAAATIRAAWVRFPGLAVVAAEQSYERLDADRYRYRSVASGFEAVVTVDADGLPIDYAGIWRRIADGPAAPGEGFVGALLAPGPARELADAAADFGWLAGGWAGEVRDVGTDGSISEGQGEWWFAWVLEGRALQDVWIVPPRWARALPRGPSAAADRYGSTIRRFDRAGGLWRITWINPVTGAANHLAGRRSGDAIELTGSDDGTPIRWRFLDITADSFRWLGERQAGGAWRTEAEFRLRRLG